MLGLDPLYVANEGKLIAIVAPEAADAVLNAMRSDALGKNAQIIGTVVESRSPIVTIRTALGTSRCVDMLRGRSTAADLLEPKGESLTCTKWELPIRFSKASRQRCSARPGQAAQSWRAHWRVGWTRSRRLSFAFEALTLDTDLPVSRSTSNTCARSRCRECSREFEVRNYELLCPAPEHRPHRRRRTRIQVSRNRRAGIG